MWVRPPPIPPLIEVDRRSIVGRFRVRPPAGTPMANWFRVKVEKHVEIAILEQANQREMTPEEVCADLIELGLASLNAWKDKTPVEDFATMQREAGLFPE